MLYAILLYIYCIEKYGINKKRCGTIWIDSQLSDNSFL